MNDVLFAKKSENVSALDGKSVFFLGFLVIIEKVGLKLKFCLILLCFWLEFNHKLEEIC